MDILSRDSQSQKVVDSLTPEHESAANRPIGTYLLLLAVTSASSALYSFTVLDYLAALLGNGIRTWLILIAVFVLSVIVGTKLASHFSSRIFNPLKVFSLVQAATGIFSAGLFSALVALSNTPTFPAHFAWLSTLLLISPQAILLGIVFPLLSFGILRCGPAKTGRSISLLYFSYASGIAAGLVVISLLMSAGINITSAIQLSCLLHVMVAFFVCSLSVDDGRNPLTLEHPLPGNLSKKPLPPGLVLLFILFIGMVTSLFEIIWLPLLLEINKNFHHITEILFTCLFLGVALGALATKNKSRKKTMPLSVLIKLQLFVFSLLGTSIIVSEIIFSESILRVVSLAGSGNLQELTNAASLHPLSNMIIACVITTTGTLSLGAAMPLTIYMERNERWDEAVLGNHYARALIGVMLGIIASFSFL